MARVISDKELKKMTDYETGRWYEYRNFDWKNATATMKELEAEGYVVKHYYTTTTVRGYYHDVILVKRGVRTNA